MERPWSEQDQIRSDHLPVITLIKQDPINIQQQLPRWIIHDNDWLNWNTTLSLEIDKSNLLSLSKPIATYNLFTSCFNYTNEKTFTISKPF